MNLPKTVGVYGYKGLRLVSYNKETPKHQEQERTKSIILSIFQYIRSGKSLTASL